MQVLVQHARAHKPTVFDVRGEVTALVLTKRDGTTVEALFDTSDFELVRTLKCSWACRWSRETESHYICGVYSEGEKKKSIYLHRLVMGVTDRKLFVDHINHDTTDNRKRNLRIVTNSENIQNRLGANRTSTSGIRGVFWSKADNRWVAVVQLDKKQHRIGSFLTKDEAAHAVALARSKMMPFSQEALSGH